MFLFCVKPATVSCYCFLFTPERVAGKEEDHPYVGDWCGDIDLNGRHASSTHSVDGGVQHEPSCVHIELK